MAILGQLDGVEEDVAAGAHGGGHAQQRNPELFVVDLAVKDHVAVDPGADLRRHRRVEVELAGLGEAVGVARRRPY